MAIDECSNTEPELMETDGSEPHFAACIRSDELRGQDRYEAGEVFEAADAEAIPTELVESFTAEALDQNAVADDGDENEAQRSETGS
jgi:hypothetical protein